MHFPLAGWNFSPQKGSSQFFAWAITLGNKFNNISEKGRILGNSYGFDTKCYWEHPWGTTWEHGRNTSTIHEKKKLSHLPPAPKTIVMTFLVRECYGSPKISIKFVKIRQNLLKFVKIRRNSLKFTLEECYDKVLNEEF